MIIPKHYNWLGFPILLCVLMIIYQKCEAQQQGEESLDTLSTSNGKNFYTGFMQNFGGLSFTTFRFWIGTVFDENVEYIVESRDGIIQQGTVNSSAPVSVSIDSSFQITGSDFNNREKGLHIYTTSEPGSIYVIAENTLSPYNQGVFLVYPCLIFDNQEEYVYYVISTESDYLSQFLLVGCEDETEISIIPSQSISLPQDLQLPSLSNILEAEYVYSGTIHQMQTVLITSNNDLTGTKIVSNKPLSVISGHECASVPSHAPGCEPLAVQLPPSLTWGNTFLLPSFSGRDTDTVFKFISAEMTNVFIACNVSLTLENVTSFQFSASTGRYCFLKSEQPLLVVQFATSGTIDRRGDPTMALVSPVDQFVNNISFLVPPANTFTEVHISVTVLAKHFKSSSVFYDGKVLDCMWTEIRDDNANISGYGCNYTITNLVNGLFSQHLVSHSEPDGLVSVLVYAFSTTKIGVAYLAGQRITVFRGNGSDIIPHDEGDFIPFLDITDFPTVGELEHTVVDGASEPIIIPNCLFFGESLVTTAFVNENGVVSFDEPWQFSYPDQFPTNYYWTQLGKAIAPFWSDNDIRKAGTVRYATYCNLTNTEGCNNHPDGQTILDEVNRFIQENRRENSEFYAGHWMLIAQWDHVHPYPHGSDDTQGISEQELSKTNTYQAIIVSDTIHTSAVFTYICGDLQWSATGSSSRAAVVGYSSAGRQYLNHRLSGYASIGDSLSCAVRLGRRRKRQSRGDSTIVDVQNIIKECGTMFSLDGRRYDDALQESQSHLEPCPCTLAQAKEDSARFRPQPHPDENCYVSMKPAIIIKNEPLGGDPKLSIYQECCYDESEGALIRTNSAEAGSVILQNPISHAEAYGRDDNNADFSDKAFKTTCCDATLADEPGDYCQKYFMRRPRNMCEGYKPPTIGIARGDPHFTTFDGVNYDFQGEGEFTLFETSINSFRIQGRMRHLNLNFDGAPTWHVSLAFGDENGAFEFDAEQGISQTRPGPINQFGFINVDTVLTANNGMVEFRRVKNKKYVADFFDYGISITIKTPKHSVYNNFLNLQVRIPSSYRGRVRGMFGNFDGDSAVEFFERGGSDSHIAYTVATRPDFRVFTPLLSWRTTPEESLFVDLTNKRRKRQTSPQIPILFEDLNFTDAQRDFCDNSPACLFDLAVTGDNDVAQTTLDSEKESNATIATINNFPPNITAKANLRVNIREESTLVLTVVDSNDNFTLNIRDGLPDNPDLEELSDGQFVFRWTLQQVTNESVVFIANDSRGAASLFTPTVEICACANGGECTLAGVLTSNLTVVMKCLCPEAFAGLLCEEDRNGCSEIECFEGVECMDVPAPGVGAVCGDCPPGYTGDSLKCYDIDECFLDASLCDQLCTNTEGGYVCSCREGYQLVEKTNQCADINECGMINDCQQLCVNNEGSYTCSCEEGFSLSDNDRDCIANVPCDGSCSFGCAVINGQEQCFCPVGFQLDSDSGTQCNDIDECSESNPCEQLCTNNAGSFSCSCREGFQLLDDGLQCEDVDECFRAALRSIDICENVTNSLCVNNEGSFDCNCAQRYEIINNTCLRIQDEPPPPVVQVVDDIGEENSLYFRSSVLTLDTFSSNQQQLFRDTTAIAVNTYCNVRSCNLILPNGDVQSVRAALVISSANVAVPISFFEEDNDNGNLLFIVYVQIGENYLSKDHLESAIMNSTELYKINGFLPTLELTPSPPVILGGVTLIGIIVGSVGAVLLILMALLICYCKKFDICDKSSDDKETVELK